MNHPQSAQSNWCEPGLVRWRADPSIACRNAQESGSLILLFQMLGRLDDEFCCPNARLARLMLFSNPTVADYINATFEPVWESTRPVPMVSIDFRNGHIISRPLPGNIATYVCAPDGQVLDILPGMHTPASYLAQLRWFKTLEYIAAMPLERRQAALFDYHSDAIKRLSLQPTMQPARVHPALASTDGTQAIQGGPQAVQSAPAPTSTGEGQFVQAGTQRSMKAVPNPTRPDLPEVSPGVQQLTMDEASQWHALVEATKANEPFQRAAIHEKLARSQPVRPDGIVKWLHREVLHSDLDDPYLGLGKLPF